MNHSETFSELYSPLTNTGHRACDTFHLEICATLAGTVAWLPLALLAALFSAFRGIDAASRHGRFWWAHAHFHCRCVSGCPRIRQVVEQTKEVKSGSTNQRRLLPSTTSVDESCRYSSVSRGKRTVSRTGASTSNKRSRLCGPIFL